MIHSPSKSKGFTLIEILVATAVAAMLLTAIMLNLGVRTSLVDAATQERPKAQLAAYLDELQMKYTAAEIESYVGTDPMSSGLSYQEAGMPSKLVTVSRQSIGSNAEQIEVLAIEVTSSSNALTRWITPQQ